MNIHNQSLIDVVINTDSFLRDVTSRSQTALLCFLSPNLHQPKDIPVSRGKGGGRRLPLRLVGFFNHRRHRRKQQNAATHPPTHPPAG